MAGKPPFVGEKRSYCLGDIALVKAGNVAPKSQCFSDSGIPFVRAGSLPALLTGKPISSLEKIERGVAENLGMKLFPKGTVLFAKSGMSCMTGNVYMLPEPCYAVSHLACIMPRDELLSQWILYFFRYNKPISLIENPSFPSIKLSKLSSIGLDLPNREEMFREVQMLNAIGVQNKLCADQIKKLDQLIKSRFVEMFGHCSKRVYLGDVCKFRSGKTVPKEKELHQGDYLYVKVGDLNLPGNETEIKTSRLFLDSATAEKNLIPKGAVVFPKRGGAIGTNKKRVTSESCCLDLNLMSVIPGEQISSSYLLAWFNQMDLADIANGSTVPQINNKDLDGLAIPLPTMEVQQEFADFVEQVDKSRFVVQQQIDKLRTLYDSLAQEYFGD